MRHLRFRPFLHTSILLLSALFFVHMRRVTDIQAFLAEHSAELRSGEKDENGEGKPSRMMAEHAEQLREAIRAVGPDQAPAFLLLNRHALNVTLNFVCNLHLFPGAAQRLVAVVFDAHSARVLHAAFPRMPVVRWRLEALSHKFGSGDGRYQLFQYFRAQLAAFLTQLTDSFWMVQADTIWTQDLFQLIDVDGSEYGQADLIFDSEGEDGLLRSMIAGGYFFVRSSARTRRFFHRVAHFLLRHFATDNNVMARQCLQAEDGLKCAQIPYSVISNWRQGHESSAPLFQFDGGDSSATKFEKMRAAGHLFVELGRKKMMRMKKKKVVEEGKRDETEDEEEERMRRRKDEAEERKKRRRDEDEEDEGEEEVPKCLDDGERENHPKNKTEMERRGGKSRSNLALTTLHALAEWAYVACPALRHFLLVYLFPYYAAHLFI